MTEIGPHLLGRKRSSVDLRDFRLENFLGLGAVATALTPAELAVTATGELKLTSVSYKQWASTKYADVTKTHWWKAFDALAQISQPTPPPANSVWTDSEPVLDQGNYGTCVGNGWAQWGNTLPFDDKFAEKDARAIYYEATVLDGSPDDPDSSGGGQQGATVRSGVQAMKNRLRLSAYAQSTDLTTLKAWLATKGPVTIGSDWTNDMFNPDAQNYVKPTGGVAGGHCYVLLGYLTTQDAFKFLNSWGTSWGDGGYFYMKSADFQTLLKSYGEAYTSVELAL